MNHLKHSIFWFAFAILVALAGLAYSGSDVRSRGNCVSESIMNAERWTQLTGRPTKIAVMNLREGYDHSQAMGQEEDGSWTYLTTHHSDGLLRRWQKHFDKEPYRYLDVDEFVKEQEKINPLTEGN